MAELGPAQPQFVINPTFWIFLISLYFSIGCSFARPFRSILFLGARSRFISVPQLCRRCNLETGTTELEGSITLMSGALCMTRPEAFTRWIALIKVITKRRKRNGMMTVIQSMRCSRWILRTLLLLYGSKLPSFQRFIPDLGSGWYILANDKELFSSSFEVDTFAVWSSPMAVTKISVVTSSKSYSSLYFSLRRNKIGQTGPYDLDLANTGFLTFFVLKIWWSIIKYVR